MRTDTYDLAALRLTPGEGRRLDLSVAVDPLELGDETYAVTDPAGADSLALRLDISRTHGPGYALHITFAAALHGPCMRCLGPVPAAGVRFDVDSREVSLPPFERELDEDEEPEPRHIREEVESPYVDREGVLSVGAWARDALVLALPTTLLCRPDCLGLCVICGENLNTAGPDHHHDAPPDARWAALSELKFENSSEN